MQAKLWGEVVSLSRYGLVLCTIWPGSSISGTWEDWASGPFLCLDFPGKSLRKAWMGILFACEHYSRSFPRPWETKARTFKMRHPIVILLSFGGKKKKTHTSLSFCATANIATFLAGRGSYFVYVWTRILIDRISCNPILNYRFSSRLMQQIVSK